MRKTTLRAGLLGLVLAVSASIPAFGAKVIGLDGATVRHSSGTVKGQWTDGGEGGWNAWDSTGRDRSEIVIYGDNQQSNVDYLYYDLKQIPLNEKEGALAISVAPRLYNQSADTLFSVTDENWENIWGLDVEYNWDRPCLKYNTTGSEPMGLAWFPTSDKTKPFRVVITWKNGVATQYLNGAKTGSDKADFITSQLFRARYLVLGATPTNQVPNTVYAFMWGTITEFGLYTKAEDAFDIAKPEAVARLLADAPWGGEVRVTWEASKSTDVVRYDIYRGAGAPPKEADKPYQSTSALEFTDTNVIPGIEYYYAVVAVDGVGNKSPLSEIVKVKALSGDGPAITGVSVEPAGRPVRPGDVLTITLKGASGGKSFADIQGHTADIPLTEQRGTGLYVGNYTVTDADVAATRGTYKIIGKLADDYGASLLAGPDVLVISAADLNDRTPPSIQGVEHNAWSVAGLSGKLVPGDVINVTVKGEAGGFASFKLAGQTASQVMAETSPGVYTGSYTVGWQDEGDAVGVVATLADFAGNTASLTAGKTIAIDSRVRLIVTAKNALLPADTKAQTRLVVRAENANGDEVPGHELALTLSTTEEYTGVVGGGILQGKQATKEDVDDIEVKWGGVTDIFGEIPATYTAGFAAKTALIVAKDLTTGDVGAGWLNTYVAATLAIKLTPVLGKIADPAVLRMAITPGWLTADGRSKARVKAWLTDPAGKAIPNARVDFTLATNNGAIKVVRGVTDANGLAEADYRAGTMAGFVTILAVAPEYGVIQSAKFELRSDAPAKIDLTASLLVLPANGVSTSDLRALVTDINDNPNKSVPVLFSVIEGTGTVTPGDAMTNNDGVVLAKYTAGRTAGTVVVEARHTSRSPTQDELRRIYGTVFVPRVMADQERERMTVLEWLVKNGDEVKKGQSLVKLVIRRQTWTLTAPEDGIFVRQVRHNKDRVEVGDTIGYVEIDPEVWADKYTK